MSLLPANEALTVTIIRAENAAVDTSKQGTGDDDALSNWSNVPLNFDRKESPLKGRAPKTRTNANTTAMPTRRRRTSDF